MIPVPITDPSDPYDAWALTNNGYALDKFFMRTSDSNGHTSLIHVKLGPNLHNMLNMLVGDDQLPYTSQASVIRDALVHRVRYILDQQARANAGQTDPVTTSLWQTEVFRHRIEQAREMRAENTRTLATLWEEVQELCLRNDYTTAHEWIDNYEDLVLDYEDIDDRRFGVEQVEQMRAFVVAQRENRATPAPSIPAQWR